MPPLSPSPFESFPSFTSKSRSPKHIALHRCPSKKIPAACTGRTDESGASCSAPSSTSPSDSASSTSTSKIRRYPSKCKSKVISGISAILLMPMPFLDKEKEKDAHVAGFDGVNLEELASEPRGLRRILSRQPRPKAGRRRNSLILPEVDMPDVPDEPNCPAQPYECSTRDRPPPMADRAVRFSVSAPPEKLAPRPECRADDEPAWCDFMLNLTNPNFRGHESRDQWHEIPAEKKRRSYWPWTQMFT
ncbi:hypothetical protein K438DRAFT_1767667 [Mycena galopus ATCC 62051]|nr:hypothetical protein K438DRAFT_1767667 [Mycena galopus ATCC 62051]